MLMNKPCWLLLQLASNINFSLDSLSSSPFSLGTAGSSVSHSQDPVGAFTQGQDPQRLLTSLLGMIVLPIKYTHFDIVSRIWLKLGNAEIEDINMPVLTVHGLNPHSRVGIKWEESATPVQTPWQPCPSTHRPHLCPARGRQKPHTNHMSHLDSNPS